MTGRVLVAYGNSANFVSTVGEYLAALGSHLRFALRYVQVTNGAEFAAALCAGRIIGDRSCREGAESRDRP
jgi:hypothetical protein